MAVKARMSSVASAVPFDNASNGFTAQDVQAAIEEIGASASPGFSFGRGSANNGTWLNRVGEVPSNRSGPTVGINSPVIFQVYVSAQDMGTFTVEVYEHEGNSINLILLGSVDIISARGGTFNVSFPTSKGKQLAVRISTGSSIRNVGVDIIVRGNA